MWFLYLFYRIGAFLAVAYTVWCVKSDDIAGTVFGCFAMYCIRDWLIRMDGE